MPPRPDPIPSVEAFIESEALENRAESTLRDKRWAAQAFCRWRAENGLEGDPTWDEVREYLQYKKKKGMKDSSCFTTGVHLRGFLSFLEIEVWKNPFSRHTVDEPRVVDAEYARGLHDLDISLQDKVLVMILFSLAIRRSEVLSLKKADFTARPGKVRVTRKKRKIGIRVDYLPVEPKVLELIKEYMAAEMLGPDDRLFPFEKDWPYYHLKRIVKEHGLQYFNPHAFRHGRANQLDEEEGTTVTELQAILGHNDIRSTQRYTHVKEARIEKAMKPAF